MILKGDIVTLRPIEYEDLEFIRGLINDPDMEKTITGWSWPISKKDEEQWYTNFHNSDRFIRFIIETECKNIVGFTGLKDIDWKNGKVVSGGIRISKNFQSKGIATDAYATLIKYAFEELRLHRIESSAFEDNIASLKFLEKLGYVREGLLRECIFKAGKFHNVVVLGLLKEDFYRNYMNLNYPIGK